MKNEPPRFFDDPANVKRVLFILYGVCALLFVLDFILHRHAVHDWEGVWGFYPAYGFVGCVLLVVIAKWMRTFLMREKDYYDADEAVRQKEDSNVDA